MKKVGDEKFQAQLYEEAAAIYTFVLNYPTFKDTFFITEKLIRKRAVCFYKMVSSLFYKFYKACNITLKQNRRLVIPLTLLLTCPWSDLQLMHVISHRTDILRPSRTAKKVRIL